MIGIVLHWYYLPLAIALLIGAALSLLDGDDGPVCVALFLCVFALLVRWLP